MSKTASLSALIPIIEAHSDLEDSVIFSETILKSFGGLMMDLWIMELRLIIEQRLSKHFGKNEFAKGKNHINGIENFWGFCKLRLSKFKGIKKENFLLHLKECEFRYNIKIENKNLYKELLKIVRNNPLKFP